jgi:nucleoside-diphosphate-sugar epimerase
MAIDFFEKEVEKLTTRFNRLYGGRTVCDIRSRYLCILAICRVSMLSRTIREMTDEKRIGEMTREFCHIRETLNHFFDLMEAQPERRSYASKRDDERVMAGG